MGEIKKIICFGDSNTHGYNSKTMGRFSEDERWTKLLGKYLGEEYDVVEEGLEGRTACFDDPLFEGLCGFHYLYPCLMTHKPVDLLIIMLGTNELKTTYNKSIEEIGDIFEKYFVKTILNRKSQFQNKYPELLDNPELKALHASLEQKFS